MRIDISEILKNEGSSLEFDFQTDLSEFEPNAVSTLELSGPVQVKGRVVNQAGVVCVRGEARAVYQGACSRCMEPVQKEESLPFELDVLGNCFSGDYSDVEALKSGELLFDELIYNMVAMSVPMRFLCRDDCKGLCSEGGANLNLEQCSWKKEEIDPRLAVLKDFFK